MGAIEYYVAGCFHERACYKSESTCEFVDLLSCFKALGFRYSIITASTKNERLREKLAASCRQIKVHGLKRPPCAAWNRRDIT